MLAGAHDGGGILAGKKCWKWKLERKKYTSRSRGNNSLLHGDPPKMGGFTGHSEFTMTSKTSPLTLENNKKFYKSN